LEKKFPFKFIFQTDLESPPSLEGNYFSNCSFYNGNQYLFYNKWDGGEISKWKCERFGNFL